MDTYDAAKRYKNDDNSLVMLAGRDYGSGINIITTSFSPMKKH